MLRFPHSDGDNLQVLGPLWDGVFPSLASFNLLSTRLLASENQNARLCSPKLESAGPATLDMLGNDASVVVYVKIHCPTLVSAMNFSMWYASTKVPNAPPPHQTASPAIISIRFTCLKTAQAHQEGKYIFE